MLNNSHTTPSLIFLLMVFISSFANAATTNSDCKVVFDDKPAIECTSEYTNILKNAPWQSMYSDGAESSPEHFHGFMFKHDLYTETQFNRTAVGSSLNLDFAVDIPNLADSKYFLVTIDNEFQTKFSINEDEFLTAHENCKDVDKYCGYPFSYYMDGIFNNKIDNLVIAHREFSWLTKDAGHFMFNLNVYLEQYGYKSNEDRLYDIKINILDTYHKSIAKAKFTLNLSKFNQPNDTFIELTHELKNNVLILNSKNASDKEGGFEFTLYVSKGSVVHKLVLPPITPLSISLPPDLTYLSISTNHYKGIHDYETEIEIINQDRQN